MEYTKIIGLCLISLSAVIVFVYLLRKNESFFNLRNTVKGHLHLFSECKSQYVIFYVLPLFFSVGLAMIYEAGEVFYSNLSVIVSILLSMLLAILSILTGKDYRSVSDDGQRERIKVVTKETITAITFDVLLCIFLLLYGLVMIVIEGVQFDTDIFKRIFAGIAYYNFSVILLNLLLIVKRMSKIIEFDFTVQKGDKQ